MAFFFPGAKWLSGVVPYVIDEEDFPASDAQRAIIQGAINKWNTTGLISLTQRDDQRDYVAFVKYHERCDSHVGRFGGRQEIRCSIMQEGAILHEIGHAIGMHHEHQRPGRDLKVVVDESVRDDPNYRMLRNEVPITSYDCDSIMHYEQIDGRIAPTGCGSIGGNLITASDQAGVRRMYQAMVGEKIATYNWTSGWSTAEFYEASGNPYLFLLKRNTGTVHLQRVRDDGSIETPQFAEYDWSSGWTTARFYRTGGQLNLFLLKKGNGLVHLQRINNDGTIQSPQFAEYNWSSGWSQVEFYESGGRLYLFLLKENNGTVHLQRINNDGTIQSPQFAEYDWSDGYSTARAYEVDGEPYLFLLKVNSGRAYVQRILNDGRIETPQIDSYNWSRGWSIGEFYQSFGEPYLILLKYNNGTSHVQRIAHSGYLNGQQPGTIQSPQLTSYNWSRGYTQLNFYEVRGKPYLFFLKEETGDAYVHRIGHG